MRIVFVREEYDEYLAIQKQAGRTPLTYSAWQAARKIPKHLREVYMPKSHAEERSERHSQEDQDWYDYGAYCRGLASLENVPSFTEWRELPKDEAGNRFSSQDLVETSLQLINTTAQKIAADAWDEGHNALPNRTNPYRRN